MDPKQRIDMYRVLLDTARAQLYRYAAHRDWANAAKWQRNVEQMKHLLKQAEGRP